MELHARNTRRALSTAKVANGKVDAGKKGNGGKVNRRKTKMGDAALSSPTVSQSHRTMSSAMSSGISGGMSSGVDTATAVEATETRKRMAVKSIHSHQVQAGSAALNSPAQQVQQSNMQTNVAKYDSKSVSVTTSRGGTKTSEVRLGRGANTRRNVNG